MDQVQHFSKSKDIDLPAEFIDLIDCALFAVLIVRFSDGLIRYVNSFAAEYFEMPAEEMYTRRAPEFWVNKESRGKFIQSLIVNGQVNELEVELQTGNGDKKVALLSSRCFIHTGERLVYTMFADITKLKKTEKAFQESEARYHSLYRMMKLMTNTVPDMIWAKDLDGRYLFANRAVRENHLCCDPDESPIGKNDTFFAMRERAEGYQYTADIASQRSDLIVKQTQKPGRFLEEGIVRNRLRAMDISKAPLFSEAGELIGTVGSGRDVTSELANQKALEESEKRFRLLADNVGDVLWVSDVGFKPNYVTPSIEKLSGYTPEEFLATPFEAHMTAHYQRKYFRLCGIMSRAVIYKRDIPSRFFEFEGIRKDGSLYWTEVLATPMWDKDGTLQGWTGVIRDTTRRVLEQRNLEYAKELALSASQTKSEFLANMSHEIRTPMNGVLGMLQLLKDTSLDPVQEKYVLTALDSSRILLNIISDILDFSKIEAGKINLVDTTFSIRDLVASVVESFETLIDRDRVTIKFFVHESVPNRIIADESRLKQIFFNLIGNAVKFTPEGDISINVFCAENNSSDKITLECHVTDTGVGISELVVNRLFEPFVQEDGSFKRKYGGTGLGLSIVKSLAELMGGDVRLLSASGNGTNAIFKIIAKRVLPREPKQRLSAGSGNLPAALPPLNILVVEDEKINSMVITAMLNKFGHSVELATDGLQALEKIKFHQYDCIFMDIQMPEMDGVETTRIIRSTMGEDKKHLPIVALTAHAMKGDKEKFLEVGMDDYLAKPVDVNSMYKVLRNVYERHLLTGKNDH